MLPDSASGQKRTLGLPGGWPGGNFHFRPKANICTSACFGRRAYRWVRLDVGLLVGLRRPKIEPYQGEIPPYGALWVSRITGPTGLPIG